MEPLTDYALIPVINAAHASQVMVAYKSPETGHLGRPSKKSDVEPGHPHPGDPHGSFRRLPPPWRRRIRPRRVGGLSGAREAFDGDMGNNGSSLAEMRRL
ncbi:hypothetical protein HPP92_000425 [Vanilla planifolia]|uniref:Uncharacterized protein n=1 Tax=Vanilla planifolia TaxID=51239 RepID=A0A835S0K9_VANPL|nr:hypothetical protein HPP92_000425 [Vanilla planifolia]